MYKLINNAVSAGFGAFAGAWVAWLMSARAEKQRNREKYVSLPIILHDDLETIYNLFSEIPDDCVKEIEGNKLIEFDMPLPEFSLSKEQIYQIAALAPDKDIRCMVLSNGVIVDVDKFGYWGLDMIMFIGTRQGGGACRLCLHTSQTNLLLEAVPRKGDTPRKKIGFVHEELKQAQS